MTLAVEGTYISDTSMTCVVPEMTGSSALEVSVDGSPFSTSKKVILNNLNFDFYNILNKINNRCSLKEYQML